jgi:hypothetical protein
VRCRFAGTTTIIDGHRNILLIAKLYMIGDDFETALTPF